MCHIQKLSKISIAWGIAEIQKEIQFRIFTFHSDKTIQMACSCAYDILCSTVKVQGEVHCPYISIICFDPTYCMWRDWFWTLLLAVPLQQSVRFTKREFMMLVVRIRHFGNHFWLKAILIMTMILLKGSWEWRGEKDWEWRSLNVKCPRFISISDRHY